MFFILQCMWLFGVESGVPEIPEKMDVAVHFQPLAHFVGKEWTTTFADGKTTDTMTFEWLFNGRFLRNNHWVTNAEGQVVYRGETVYAWDFKEERIAWYYFNSSGGHLMGYLERTAEGYDVGGKNNAPGNQTSDIKGKFIFTESGWQSIQYFLKDGSWKEQFRLTYKEKTKS